MRKRILTCLSLALALSLALMFVLAACSGPAPAAPSGEPTGAEVPPSDAQPTPPVVITPPVPGVPSPAGSEPPAPDIVTPVTVSPQPDPQPQPDSQTQPDPQPSPEPSQPQVLTMEQVYRAALETIYSDRRYPNGDEVATGEGYQMEGNDFAIFDVDGDGQAELIYQNDNSYMAGMVTTVYGFDRDTGMLYQELSGFVAMEFYDNGVVSIMASHNHGLSALDDFWPYALYQYDPGSDGYLMAGSLDAWDGSLFPKDYEGNPFPTDKDDDGDFIVFTITSGGQEVVTTCVDDPEYREWVDSYLAGASKLELPWQNMTEENIRAAAP